MRELDLKTRKGIDLEYRAQGRKSQPPLFVDKTFRRDLKPHRKWLNSTKYAGQARIMAAATYMAAGGWSAGEEGGGGVMHDPIGSEGVSERHREKKNEEKGGL